MEGYTNCPMQTQPECDSDEPFTDGVGKVAGFMAHIHVHHPAAVQIGYPANLSRSMPAWPPKPTNGARWSVCAATSHGRPSQKNACH